MARTIDKPSGRAGQDMKCSACDPGAWLTQVWSDREQYTRQATVLRIAIERCHLNGECTQRWEALEPVLYNSRMRYCGLCKSAVHLVEHEAEMDELTRMGKSVAILRGDLCRRQLG